VVLVTDSSKGLGWAMAQALAGAGAHVVLNSRDPTALGAREEELAAAGDASSSAAFNVTDKSAVRLRWNRWIVSSTASTSSSTTPASSAATCCMT
jgi:NAD(P)-dependent dehydrogenase (short-subunit alcohol dehydrogenase family)